MKQDIVILGGGGHCGVLIPMLQDHYQIMGIYDTGLKQSHHPEYDFPVWQKDEEVTSRFAPGEVLLVNAVGSAGSMQARHAIFMHWKTKGYRFAGVTADSALVVRNSRIGEGSQVLTRAIVENNAAIGDNCIINTMAQVNHDNRIGHSVHISAGAILCGAVTVGDQTHVGAGAIVLQNITIGSHCLIGAGAIVHRDVPDYSTVYPADGKVVTKPPE